MNSTHPRYCRGERRPGTQLRRHGFSTVELAVSLTLFMFISLFVSLAVARSLGASATAKSVRAGESAASDVLAKLSTTSYDTLVGGSFTAPDPCPGSGVGTAATTCAKVGNTSVTIGYRYLAADGTCSTTATTGIATASNAYVGLCAYIKDVNGAAPPSTAQPMVRYINAPGPQYDYLNSKSVVRVAVSSSTLSGTALERNVTLVRKSAPATALVTKKISATAMAAYLPVAATACTDADPCMVVMTICASAPCAPFSDATVGFYGTAVGPSARIVTAANTVTDTSLSVEKLPTLSLSLTATNGEVSTPLAPSSSYPSVTNTVCLWLTYNSDSTSAVPLCNSNASAPGTINATSYTDPVSGWTLPLPTGRPTLTVDPPTAVCGAPGQYGIDSTGAATAAKVCTSWTWGQPAELPRTLDVKADTATVATVNWVARADGAAAPSAGWPADPAPAWSYPRPVPGCAAAGTCTPTLVAPEASACPGQHCLTTGTLNTPYLVRPLNPEVVAAGQQGTFNVSAYNPLAGGVYAYTATGPGLTNQVLPGPAGTLRVGTTTVPATPGTLLTSSTTQLATAALSYARPSGYTAPVTVNLRLCPAASATPATCTGGATRAFTILEGSPYGVLAFQPVGGYTAAQGASTAVTVKLTDPVTGLATAGREVAFNFDGRATPTTSGPYVTGVDGTVTVPVTVSDTATTGQIYASTVASPSQGSTATSATLTVLPTPRNLALAETDAAPLMQNGSKNYTATATDASGSPVSGVSVNGALATGEGVTPTDVTITSTCVTGVDGTCQLSVSAAATAVPATYFASAVFPGVSSSSVPATVLQALRTATFRDGTPAFPQNSGPNPATLVLTDASGAALPNTGNVTVTGSTAVGPASSGNPRTATVTTNADGEAALDLYASPAAAVGTVNLTVAQAVPGLPQAQWPTTTVAVSVSTGNVVITELGTATVAQGGSANMTIKAATTGGVAQPGKDITLLSGAPGLTVPSTVTTGADGTVTFTISAAANLPAGAAAVIATTPGAGAASLPVTVTSTVATLTVDGAVPQGGSAALKVFARDGTGVAVAGVTVSLSTVTFSGNTIVTFSPASAVTTSHSAPDTTDPYASITGTNTVPAAATSYTGSGTANGTPIAVAINVSPVVAAVTPATGAMTATVTAPVSSTVTATDKTSAALPGGAVKVSWSGASPVGPDGWNPIGVFGGATVPPAPDVPRPPDPSKPLPTAASTDTSGQATVFAQPSTATKAGTYTANVTVTTGATSVTATRTITFVAAPTAPTITSITPGNGKAVVNFTAPSSNGGAAISGYEYSLTPAAVVGHVARATSSGAQDTAFNSGGAGANGTVYTAAIGTDGKIVIGGDFTTYNGVSRPGVARLNTDGTLDTSFTPAAGLTASSGPAAAYAVAIQTDGKVLVGGLFDFYNGTPVSNLARLNSNGALDTSFSADGPDGAVSALLLDAGGKVVVGGAYTTVGGTPVANLARLNSDGTVDSTFAGGGPAGPVAAVAAAGSNYLIGGNFDSYAGTDVGNLARISSDGTLDATFNSGGAGTDGPVAALAVQSDGAALVGGNFTTYNAAAAPDNVMRLSTSGALDATFNSGGAGANGPVASIALQTDGKAVLGGNFTTYNGTGKNRLARLSTSGALDATFNSGGAGANAYVYDVNVATGGSVVFGGLFTTYNDTWLPANPPVVGSPLTISGLTNATTYQVRIRAVNAQGSGLASNTVPVTPAPTVPDAPTITSVTGANTAATVVFAAPASDGGAAVTNYQYSTDNGATWVTRSPASTVSPLTISGLTNFTSYQVKLRAVNSVGVSAAAGPSTVVPRPPGSVFVPITPARAYDSRSGGGTLAAGTSRVVSLAAAGVPAGATAVAYNLTAVTPSAPGTLSVNAGDQAGDGGTAVVNMPATGLTVANASTVAVDASSQIRVFANSANADFIVDVEGYYLPETSNAAGGVFTPVDPVRAYDSRTAGSGGTSLPMTAGTNRLITLTGVGGIPATATAVAYNVTVSGQSGNGSFAVTPGSASSTPTSLINWPSPVTRSNAVTTGVDGSGQIRLYANTATTDVTVDVVGYFTPANTTPAGGRFYPLTPARAYNSSVSGGALAAGANRYLPLTSAGVPAGASGAAYNVTAFSQTASGTFAATGGANWAGTASLLNWPQSSYSLSNASAGGLDASAQIRLWNSSSGTSEVIVDVFGYYR